MLDDKADDLIKKAMEMALEGDGHMLKASLEGLVPAYEANSGYISANFEGALTDKGTRVLELLGNGELTVDDAASLLTAISAQANIMKTDEFEKRISEIEMRNG